MKMDQAEDLALKETLSESQKLAQELDISLTEVLLLRQITCIRWLCQSKANEKKL